MLINIKGRPMAEMVRQKKTMRTRVFGFIAIFNFIFAFGKDMNFFNGCARNPIRGIWI